MTTETETITDVSQLSKRERLIEATRQDGRQLVSIRRIDDLIPIPGADRIQTAMIGGWPIVVKVGEFQVGQLGLYFETDSFLNADDPRFAFLAEKRVVTKDADGNEKVSITKSVTDWNGIEGIRLKSIKLRKQLSQGLLLPLDMFPEIAEKSSDGKQWLVSIPVGQQGGEDDDQLPEVYQAIAAYPDEFSEEFQSIRKLNFTTVLGVIKWEKIEKQSGGANLAGKTAGNFPSFLRKSDQTRCQGLAQEIFGYEERRVPFIPPEDMPAEAIAVLRESGKVIPDGEGGLVRLYPPTASRDTRFEATIKGDGSSMTTYRLTVREEEGIDTIKYGVCSRNLELKLDDPDNAENAFVKVFNEQVLPFLQDNYIGGAIALQGELMGPGIQGNPDNLSELQFFVYNVFDIDRGEFLLPQERHDLIEALREDAVRRGVTIPLRHLPVLKYNVTLAEMGITNMAELLAASDGPGMNCAVREGIVYKAMDNHFQFKAISNKWLLANDA